MEIRRHFGAKAKEKEANDDFGFMNQPECRSSHEFTENEVCPRRFPYLHY